MADPTPTPSPAVVPLGPPLRLSAAADALARVTPADVRAAQAYWEAHARGLAGLLRDVLASASTEGGTP